MLSPVDGFAQYSQVNVAGVSCGGSTTADRSTGDKQSLTAAYVVVGVVTVLLVVAIVTIIR